MLLLIKKDEMFAVTGSEETLEVLPICAKAVKRMPLMVVEFCLT